MLYDNSLGLYRSLVASLLLFFLNFGVVYSDVIISRMAGSSAIEITSCDRDAGAICSLKWKGKEFIDDFDRGRQLQSASNFPPVPEGYNPTEAGSVIDGQFLGDIPEYAYHINPRPNHLISSSRLKGRRSTSNSLATATEMAFWVPVEDVNGEVEYQSKRYKVLSGHQLNKEVTIGVYGLPHVIEYLTQFTIPNEVLPHSHGVFEAVTGYMPGEFSDFWVFNISTNEFRKVEGSTGEQGSPLIFSTPNGAWAMGIYSPDSPQTVFPDKGYGMFKMLNGTMYLELAAQVEKYTISVHIS